MKSMMGRTTIREIKGSFGRYFAILAIVALGVSFFAGLKVTKDVMVASADQYYRQEQLYDYRLLCTLGFEEADVEALAAKEGVRSVAGAYSADIICLDGSENAKVMKVHSLTEGVNGVVLRSGRMPEAPDECVVDCNYYGKDAIGSKVYLAESNEQEDLENFAYREYTITGIVQSSLYTQFERGNSTLGNGQVQGFLYLLPEGFQMEVYTEIYVKFHGDEQIYSDAYADFLAQKEELWESYCERQGQRRFQSILGEAEEELEEAEKELEEKRREAQEELLDAREELLDAQAELAEGEEEFRDGEQKLADGERKLDKGARELRDGEETLAQKEQELLDAKQTIAENEALLAEKRQEYEKGRADFESGKKQTESARKDLDAGLSQIEAAQMQFDQAQEQIQAELDKLQLAVDMGVLDPALDTTQALFQELYAAQAALDTQKAEAGLDGKRAQIQAGYAQLAGAEAQLNQAYMQLQDAAEQLLAADEELASAREQVARGEQEIADAWQELDTARRDLADGRSKLEENRSKLEDARRELEEGRRKLEDGWKEYNEACQEFEEEIANAQGEIADARQEIADLEEPDTYVLGRDTNIGYVLFEKDSTIVDGIANVFPVFFFLVAALVCMTTMNRMVEEQRTQIGVLKALGYGEATIMGKFLFYSGSAALTGCLGGYYLGIHLFPLVIWKAYGIMYRFGGIVYVFHWPLLFISLAGALACSMGTTWVSCRHELKEVAAGLMRPKSPKAGKRVLLERIPFIWRRLKFLHKVSVRNVVRYKKRFFMMVIGISGCSALLVTGFGVQDSVTDIANQQFEKIQVYDVGIAMSDPIEMKQDTPDNGEKGISWQEDGNLTDLVQILEQAGATYTVAHEDSLDLVTGQGNKTVNLIIAEQPEEIGTYIDLHTSDGAPIPYPAGGEIVISGKLAESYGFALGDVVTLQDEARHTVQAVVSGICENYIYNYVYLDRSTYESAMGVPEFQNIYVKLQEETDVHAFGAAVMNLEEVASVTVNADTKVRFSSMMRSMDYIVIVIIVCAGALAFIVLYNLNNINITERIREIATIKVLGFYRKETAQYVFRENMVLTAIGCGLGLLLGKLLHLYVMQEVNIDMISFDVKIDPSGYLFSVLLTFLFNWVVNRMMSGKLDQINMAESLKSVD